MTVEEEARKYLEDVLGDNIGSSSEDRVAAASAILQASALASIAASLIQIADDGIVVLDATASSL